MVLLILQPFPSDNQGMIIACLWLHLVLLQIFQIWSDLFRVSFGRMSVYYFFIIIAMSDFGMRKMLFSDHGRMVPCFLQKCHKCFFPFGKPGDIGRALTYRRIFACHNRRSGRDTGWIRAICVLKENTVFHQLI